MITQPDPNNQFAYDYSNANLDEIIEQIAEINAGLNYALEGLESAATSIKDMRLEKPSTDLSFIELSIMKFRLLSEQFAKILIEIEHGITREHIKKLERASESLTDIYNHAHGHESCIQEETQPFIGNAISSLFADCTILEEELDGLPKRLRELLKSQDFSLGKAFVRKGLRVTPIYRLGTRSWTDVKIEFVSEEEVLISIANESLGKKNYRDLGFEDKRQKLSVPKLTWSRTLLFLARAGEKLQIFDDEISEKDLVVLKKRISQLRTHLKLLFSTSQDPFYSTEKAKGYKPKFKIFEREAAVPNETLEQYEEEIHQREKYYPKELRAQHLKEIGKAKRRG